MPACQCRTLFIVDLRASAPNIFTHKTLCVTQRVQARSRGGRWCWAVKVGPFLLQVVTQQRCNGHCPCDSALALQSKQQLRGTLVAGQWRGDTALTPPLFWRRSTASSVFRVGARCRALITLSPPSSPMSPSLISIHASVDVKQNGNG